MDMFKLLLTAAVPLLMAGTLSAAAGATIQKKDGRNEKAWDIQAETISGIVWEVERGRPGSRILLWELDDVRYDGNKMDDFNGLSRKLSGGRAAKLRSDAQAFLNGDTPSGFDSKQWERLKVSLHYYIAMADYLEGKWDAAVSGLENYIKECEKADNIFTQGIFARVNFASAVSGKTVNNAGGLNRFYLDALESLGMAYLKKGDAAQANAKAFTPLQNLAEAMTASSGASEYYNWGIRALRAYAKHSEAEKDFKGATDAYMSLQGVALKKNGGRPSRISYEAQLKVGFMEIKQGDTRGASARFYEATTNWVRDHSNDVNRPWQPRNDWIEPDKAYLTAGSFLGQGLVKAADARRVEDWAEALQNFSTSLAIFNSDDEIRSMALLGAANAAAQLAELNKDKKREDKRSGKMVATTSDNYARLAEKYLSELTTLLPKSKAADDSSIPDIQALINKHRRD
jgi:tetratricopeptide (TPR) repeat protein